MLLYYITPPAWGLFILLRWGIFYLYPSDLAIQKTAGHYLCLLLFIPYVLYIISAIQHIRHFREERHLLLAATIYILLYYTLATL